MKKTCGALPYIADWTWTAVWESNGFIHEMLICSTARLYLLLCGQRQLNQVSSRPLLSCTAGDEGQHLGTQAIDKDEHMHPSHTCPGSWADC